LAESDDSGNTRTEYVWLDDMPIALVADVDTSPILYFVHTDHLNRPIRMTDGGENVVWDAVYNPFGGVNSITGPAANNLRFPGQYFLMEDGLHYNWYRHYDPTIGRYIQPDPLQDVLMTASAPTASSLASYNTGDIGRELPGFADGPSVYAYVDSDPMSQVDAHGLVPLDKLFGLPGAFWKWYHRQVKKKPGDPDLTKEEAEDCYDEWKRLGQPGPDSAGSSSDNDNNNKFAIPPWLPLLPLLVPFPGNPVYGGF
jgi:RHS repeat-associated protein